MKKRIVSLCLAALMLLACLPLSVFATEAEGGVISRYTDYSKDFTATWSEDKRNEAGKTQEEYRTWLLETATFAIDQGDGPWKVGALSSDGKTFAPFTRVLFMCNDLGENVHDSQWVSTEEQYTKRVEKYMEYWNESPVGPKAGVQLWDGQTPLWKYCTKSEENLRDAISSLGTSQYAAITYTAEADGYVNFSFDHFKSTTDAQYIAILVDGVMVWPTAGGSLGALAHWYNTPTSATAATVNAALASANGTELKKGQTVAFLVRGGDIGVEMQPVINAYIPGDTILNIVDTYGTNGLVTTAPAGSTFTIPTYEGDLIFMGWDADGDGLADYEDGASFEVPGIPRLTLTALVITPARFFENMPTIENGQTVFHGGWEVGRYTPSTDEFAPFAANDGSHLYTPGTGGMWGGTGGGFYIGYDYGKIAMSGCTPDGAFVSQIRYAVEYNGKVNLDFTKLTLGRHVNEGVAASKLSYNLAIFKNNEKIWPAGDEWYNYTSPVEYSETRTNYDLLAVLHAENVFPLNVEVKIGDVFDFRVQSGNEDCYQYFSEPTVTYTEVYATPTVSSSSITLGGDTLALNAYVSIFGKTEGNTAGALYWTEAQTSYDPATGTDFGAGKTEGNATVFTYTGFAAKQMADILYVMPYATDAEGNTVYGAVSEMSVAGYAETALAQPDLNAETRALLINLVNYGAEAQTFFGYNAGNLANAFLSKDEMKIGKIDDAANVYAQTGDGHKIKTVSLICGSEIGFKFMTDAVEGASSYVLQFADNPEFTDATEIEMTATAIGDEYKAIVSIGNTAMAKTFYIRVSVDGTAGATLTYSVETYLARNYDTLDNSLYYLMLSMVAYGRSCAA